MFIESHTWKGLPHEEMAEVLSRVVPTPYKSTVAPPKEKRKKVQTNLSIKQGVVKMFDIGRGFGFLRVKGEPDVYFHISNVSDATDTMYFMRGDRVSFEPSEDNRGRPCAKDVRLVS
ncbi:cold-shock protein [Paenibacillus bouchesdurhonensis]|uniref:cold-shock protein n=1 Tax=Paenibacillus bouchesdurhonensis TaxID=1870990 RepID=UPI000DA61231|nr:cold shock domain-containing protein [Paenibacillus bouchesdurhonensis]